MDYTRKLLLIRKTLGLSQAALGKRIDLTGAHVYRLENGKSPITNIILDKYVEAFGVDPEWCPGADFDKELEWVDEQYRGLD